jgi:hypothetical protein
MDPTMKAHDLARQFLAGPDDPAVVPTCDEEDLEQHVEVRASEPASEHDRCWYDTTASRTAALRWR